MSCTIASSEWNDLVHNVTQTDTEDGSITNEHGGSVIEPAGAAQMAMPVGRMTLRSLFASKLFNFLELEGISYVVVGDTRDYPYQISSDIDIVIESGAMPAIT